MRVALVIAGDIDAGSGGFYYDRRLRDRLRERGHAVDVVSLPRGSPARKLAANLRARRIAGRLSGADIVVEDGLAHPAVLGVNRRLSVPTVALVHMIAARARGGSDVCAAVARTAVRTVERRFLRSVDAAVYNAETTRRDAAALGGPSRHVVAPPAGDRFDPEVTPAAIRDRARRGTAGSDRAGGRTASRGRAGELTMGPGASTTRTGGAADGSGPLELTFLGNVAPRKGLDDLVAGLRRVDRTDVDWRLTVVGDRTVDPAHVAAVEDAVAAAGAADRVRFTGRLDDDAVAARLRETHVLAVPSRYEPFGMVYLEGMGFGCVPVATTAGGAAEFVRDGESGFLVDPDSPAGIAAAVRRLDDRDRLARMGVAARADYESRPTWTATLDRAIDFLESVVGGKRVTGRSATDGERDREQERSAGGNSAAGGESLPEPRPSGETI